MKLNVTNRINKIYGVLLIFLIVSMSFTGCVCNDLLGQIFNMNNNILGVEDKTDYTSMELNVFFDTIKSDAANDNKISFNIVNEELHYELNNSGLYEGSEWSEPYFTIHVLCNYEFAVKEYWYKKCSKTDTESLNLAFYNYYSSNFLNGEYFNMFYEPSMCLGYSSPSNLQSDYAAVKALTSLEYVTEIKIVYYYSLPHDWMKD